MNKYYVIRDRTANDVITHSGIKGQKWGIRRFQNEDGTLTEEGRKRYGVGDSEKQNNAYNVTPKGAIRTKLYEHDIDMSKRWDENTQRLTKYGSKTSEELNKVNSTVTGNTRNIVSTVADMLPEGNGTRTHGDYSKITDTELRDRINRLNLEEQYAKLTNDLHYKRSKSEVLKEILQTVGATVGIIGSGVGIYLAIKYRKKDKK